MSVDIQSPSLCLGIVGTGAMGRGIAQIAAQAGIRVLLFDALHGAAANAREAVVATLAKLAEKGKISADALAAASTRLEVVRNLDQLASAQVIVEAVVENLDVKKQLFQHLEDIISADCILATNTSSLSVTSIAATCKAPRTGAEVKRWGIPYTTTKAIAIGAAVRAAQKAHADPIAALLAAEKGKLLFRGKVADVERRTTEGFLRGRSRFDGFDGWRGTALELDFQNEWIVARLDGAPVAMSPDLICVLDSVSGEAIGTETIRYGQRVTVVALPPPAVFLSPKGLAHVGPRAFGYDLDFKSVFAS